MKLLQDAPELDLQCFDASNDVSLGGAGRAGHPHSTNPLTPWAGFWLWVSFLLPQKSAVPVISVPPQWLQPMEGWMEGPGAAAGSWVLGAGA